ncbi:MAG: ATP-binding protein [Gemmataceae bacterium]|nr:ATP-binding protein [Gemmataceae bacterium]
MLIAMAGLPGTGKSTIAARLAAELGGVVLSKDVVRSALFPPPVLDYTREQDDITVAAIYAAATRILTTARDHPVILDGRTFSRAYQVRDLFAAAQAAGEVPRVIECVCAEDVVRERLERDRAVGIHPAGNRTFGLYLSVKDRAEPITVPKLILDTGTTPFPECVRQALQYVKRT